MEKTEKFFASWFQALPFIAGILGLGILKDKSVMTIQADRPFGLHVIIEAPSHVIETLKEY